MITSVQHMATPDPCKQYIILICFYLPTSRVPRVFLSNFTDMKIFIYFFIKITLGLFQDIINNKLPLIGDSVIVYQCENMTKSQKLTFTIIYHLTGSSQINHFHLFTFSRAIFGRVVLKNCLASAQNDMRSSQRVTHRISPFEYDSMCG